MIESRHTRARAAMAIVAASMLCGAGAWADMPIADIDKRFEIATKDFGGGTVMMTSRADGAGGPTYTTHQFDCENKTYATQSEGSEAPDVFPDPVSAQATNAFGEDDDIAPLAQHACTKHGHPIMEW
ncbi:MAG: hypothetical protein CML68_16805 [Rhodobacteraceae bacterium]|nr:hypothetical protein [Paracoccaceae bacterium]